MKYKLKNQEFNVMQILWETNRELTITDFLEYNPSLKTSTVQVALRSLLNKSYIRVSNIVQHNKVFARAYVPVVTEVDYMMELFDSSSIDPRSFFTTFIEQQTDLESLDELESMVKKQKKILSDENKI